jgi:hypothetical protein
MGKVIGRYATPQAFRVALETRLRDIALSRGADLQRLQRRAAFERLLARFFTQPDPPWLLKGGYALELRLEDRARSTLDLDLSVPAPDRLTTEADSTSCIGAAYERLQQAAECDLNDGFEFLIGRPVQMRAGAPQGSIRCHVEARLAGRVFAKFHLDVGLGDVVLGQPDWVEGSIRLDFADIPTARLALYPANQQFAEKIHAYTFPWRDRDNTRVKDLVDLVLLVHSGLLDLANLKRALWATFEARNTHPLPARLPEPPPDWAEPYAALVREIGLPVPTLQEACARLDTYWRSWELDRPGEE